MDILKKSYPGREAQIEQLAAYFGPNSGPFPPAVYIRGDISTGKSCIVGDLLSTFHIKHAIINLVECYTSKILFELILNKLTGHRVDPKVGAPFAVCDHFMDFVQHVESIESLEGSVVVFDHAEELRNMDPNLLPGLLALSELTRARISVIFLSTIAFEKYYHKLNILEPLKVHFPQYSKEELLEILALDFDQMKGSMEIDREFFRSYLNIFLPVFYRACRDLRELRHMSRKHFAKYCEPILSRELTVHDSLALWKRISPVFTTSTAGLYLRISSNDASKPARDLELPFYSKYLLIAAFLASYNSTKDDKRLFMKYHGKKRKTHHDVQRKSKVSQQLNTQMGPKAFTLDRLLAIFYSILEDKVGFNNHLLVQVSSLVELQLLSLVSDESALDERKYKCNVNFEAVQGISRMVGLNIRKYLSDFSHM